MLKMGRSYAKLNEIQKAEEWFSKAKSNNVSFGINDAYQYAQVLAMQEKRSESEAVLQELILKNPYALKEREFLADLLHYKKYYKDSATYIVKSLSINTSVSEFAPAYYKDGIVYASATPEHAAKRKYHWDNSHYLNLLYTKVVGAQFQKPAFFEKDLNTKFHDGPAVFYNNFSSMIVNRNQKNSTNSANDRELWQLGLLDAQYSKENASWKVATLPFDQASFSFLHPSISEDGNILYFVSDKPGGYGGTDIYRSIRTNGIWSEPFNVGPSINTDDNEVFPFSIDNTLYFASRGHGGLGGLDLYKSQHTVNGFSPPTNLGYPINSSKDDFSIIFSKDLATGYFASSRSGNDDLYSFEKVVGKIQLIVHAYNGVTKESLGGASIQIISATSEDISLIADGSGNFKFSLPDGTDYIAIASKDDKIGMLSGLAVEDFDRRHITHQLPAFGDTARIPCIGRIKDQDGIPIKATSITVLDETTNKEIAHLKDNSLATFFGEKDHEYRIEIRNEKGDTTIQKIRINPGDAGSKTWAMVLKQTSSPLTMSARVFKAEDDQPLAGAQVEVITFSEPNLQLITDTEGRVDFRLPPGTTYLVIGSNANYSGMHSGVVEKGLDKASIIHPVPAYGDKHGIQNKLIVALITDTNGEVIEQPHVVVTEKNSGDSVDVKIKDGLLYFKGEKEKTYILTVDHSGYTPFGEEIILTEETNDVEKLSVVLQRDNALRDLQFAVRVFKDVDSTILSGAHVSIISFSSPDQELVTDSSGIADYKLETGTAYLVMARKDNLVGNFIGTADKEFTKELVIHPIPTFEEIANRVPVIAQIIDSERNLISTAKTTITEEATGEKISLQQTESLVSFMGQPGKVYSVMVEDKNHKTVTHKISVDDSPRTGIMKFSLPVEKINEPSFDYVMGVKVVKATDKSALSGAKVVVISFSEPDQELTATEEGLASFSMVEGTDYMVVGSKNGYVGMLVGTAEKGKDKASVIHLIETRNEDETLLPVISQIIDQDGHKIKNAEITVSENESKKEIPSRFNDGFLSYLGEKGKKYNVTIQSNGNTTTHVHVVDEQADELDKDSIVILGNKSEVEENSIVKENLAASSGKSLIVFQTDQGATKVYLNDNDLFGELVEKNRQLYLQKGDTSELMGEGQLSTIASNVEILKLLQVAESEVIKLRNIYFDFNKAQLDDNDKVELEKVSEVLKSFPSVQLVVRAHADDRGHYTYNLYLSKKRAKAVGGYLIKGGISKNRILQEAMGETVPEIPCETRECTEEEHQRNRRAEFVLHSSQKLVSRGNRKSESSIPQVADKTEALVTNKTPTGYQDIIQKYGDNKVDGLKIKISLGVYRFNSTLTFNELKDVGKIEPVNMDGVTYYFLSEYLTLNEAEMVKKQVNERGIKDAYLTFYFNGKKIKIKEVVTLFESVIAK